MLPQERHRRILAAVQRDGTVSLQSLQTLFPVSVMTLWRDLRFLEEKKLVGRVRGGVVGLHIVEEPYFSAKSNAVPEIKKRLAVAASQLVQEGDILILEGGTTVAEIVPILRPRRLTILTNSLPVLNRSLNASNSWEVSSCGGQLRNISSTFVGSEAVRFFKNKKASIFFLSATGLDENAGLTDPNLQEIEVKRAMAENAQRIVAMVDSTKIGQISLSEILPFSKIDSLIIDSAASQKTLHWLRQVVREVIVTL